MRDPGQIISEAYMEDIKPGASGHPCSVVVESRDRGHSTMWSLEEWYLGSEEALGYHFSNSRYI